MIHKWNNISIIYDHFVVFPYRKAYKKMIEFTNEYITKDSIVLDAGGATGSVSKQIAPSVKSVTMIDLSNQMVAMAKAKVKKLDNVICEIQDIKELLMDDDSFDVTLCFNVLDIIEDSKKAVEELKRVTKTNGFIISSVFLKTTGFLKGFSQGLLNRFGYKPVNNWTSEEYTDFIKTQGLEIVKVVNIETPNNDICYVVSKNTK